MTPARDPSLDALLDLDGQTLFVDTAGSHWVKFVARRTDVTERPHGLPFTCTGPTALAGSILFT